MMIYVWLIFVTVATLHWNSWPYDKLPDDVKESIADMYWEETVSV